MGVSAVVKNQNYPADSRTMMITNCQARQAVEGLNDSHLTTELAVRTDLSPELIQAAMAAAYAAPDCRAQRVEEARRHLAAGIDSRQVADKIIARVLSDRLR